MECLQQLPYPVPDDIKRRVIYGGFMGGSSQLTGQQHKGSSKNYVGIGYLIKSFLAAGGSSNNDFFLAEILCVPLGSL